MIVKFMIFIMLTYLPLVCHARGTIYLMQNNVKHLYNTFYNNMFKNKYAMPNIFGKNGYLNYKDYYLGFLRIYLTNAGSSIEVNIIGTACKPWIISTDNIIAYQ